jgi:predicted esterase
MSRVRAVIATLLCATVLCTAAPTTTSTIPDTDLREMYRRELGDFLAGSSFEKFRAAHGLIESYFSTTGETRRALVQQLEASGVDPAVIGRLTRLRLHWPDLPSGSITHIDERVGPHRVRYTLGAPKSYDRRTPWPLVIRLTTLQPFITDPRPTGDQLPTMYERWVTEELARHADAIVLMPWIDLDERFGPSMAGMNSVIQSMHHAAGRVNLDPAGVYLIGTSSAAIATWNIGLHYPTYFAAICPLAGSARDEWKRVRLMSLRNVLPVVWHDASDDVIKVDESRKVVQLLRGMKLDVDYDETKDIGHVPSEPIIEQRYKAMRARTREVYPQQVSLQSSRHESVFNRADWVQIYQATRPGDETRVMMPGGRSVMVFYQFPVRIDAARTGPNRVETQVTNVQSLRFYFNDRTVDFAKPITIVINKKTRFEGMLKPSIDEMLKDQIFLGRGWRYFTGIVDIEMTPPPTTQPTTTRSSSSDRARPVGRQ